MYECYIHLLGCDAKKKKKRRCQVSCARIDQLDHDVIERTGDAEAEGGGIIAKEAF